MVDVHKSVACPERIVFAAVRMGKVRWVIGSRVSTFLHADLAHLCADE